MTVNSKRTKRGRLTTQRYQGSHKNQVYTPQPDTQNNVPFVHFIHK